MTAIFFEVAISITGNLCNHLHSHAN